MRSMTLVNCLLLGLLGWIGIKQLVDANPVEYHTLSLVCTPGERPVSFASPQRVRELMEEFSRVPQLCDSSYYESFSAVADLVSERSLSDLCTRENYARIRRFHQRFISVYTPEADKQQLEEALSDPNRLSAIPESLRQFFILFALQVNAACTRILVARVEYEYGESIREDDFLLLDEFKHERYRLIGYKYMEKVRKFHQLKISAIPNEELDEDQKLFVQVRFGDAIKKVKDACKYKFSPIYEELFVPVILLNNLGYYDKTYLSRELRFLSEKRFTRWFDIIESCEILKQVEVVQDSSVSAAVTDLARASSPVLAESARTIVLLTKEQFETEKARVESRVQAEGRAHVYDSTPVITEHKPLHFAPRMWTVEDKQVAREVHRVDKRMKKLISREISLSRWRRISYKWLKATFHKHKLQFTKKDKSSALGKLSDWMDRNRVAIRLVTSIVAVIIMTAHFAFG